MKSLELHAWGKVHPITFDLSHYADNGNLALNMLTSIDGYFEPWQNLTVNTNITCAPNCAFIDTNNNGERIIGWLTHNNLGKLTGRETYSGFCCYPEFEFDMEQLMQHVH